MGNQKTSYKSMLRGGVFLRADSRIGLNLLKNHQFFQANQVI